VQVGRHIRKHSGRKFKSGLYTETVVSVSGDRLFLSDGSWIHESAVYAID
jgi:hypothetical protein